jgi:pentatricopeptide repeat protein
VRQEALTERQELLLHQPDPAHFWAERLRPGQARTARLYNTMIRIQAAHGRLDLALTSFHEMGTDGLQPDLYTLTAMFAACAQHGHHGVQIARPLYEQMHADVALVLKGDGLPPLGAAQAELTQQLLVAYTGWVPYSPYSPLPPTPHTRARFTRDSIRITVRICSTE